MIRSSYKLCYEHAQDIINGSTEAEMKKVIPELGQFRYYWPLIGS